MRFPAFLIIASLVTGLAAPLAAGEDGGDFRFGGDAFLAGRTVTLSGEAVDDLFAAGQTVSVLSPVAGSAHTVGRNVTITSDVGENLYAAGMNVTVNGAVAGDATLAGYDVEITQPVSGDLRATGSKVSLSAPVAGSAILAGEDVVISGQILGDLALSAEHVTWTDGASVVGNVALYLDEDSKLSVPESVAPAARVTRHDMSQFERDHPDMPGAAMGAERGFGHALGGFLRGVVVTGVLATILAAVAPGWIAALRRTALDDPARVLWIGFLGLAAAVGAVPLLILTGIGAIIAPIALFAALLLGLTGYLIGTYVLGVKAITAAGRTLPESTGERAMAAFAGAVLLALIGLVPFLGWLAVFAVALAGVGALVTRWAGPSFFAG
ncbi:hypothetical protein [Celeribacter neptunius]|uniref:DUF8173 domain-containing protein n=1 Tax=Celeribacter neptunius TaxID=588602 RepID=A0A1I3W3R1_9RHOB|nr:hypothetical protein [Celeribacter neptunius]SFK02072.1 hypothetical protein SAMN04487991_3559 [Celeribacter neptunius]